MKKLLLIAFVLLLLVVGGVFLFPQKDEIEVKQPFQSPPQSQDVEPEPEPETKPDPPKTTPAPQPETGIVLLDVPFLAQAPFGQWSDPIYQNACEEASLLMANLWIRGVKSISKEEATLELKKFADFEIEKYNNFYDHSAVDTAQIMRDYFDYHNIEIKENIVVEDIINQLLNGNLVIVPVNGQVLKNPYYTPPGPPEHMVVIIGYDFRTKEFITNDVGTRQGEGFRYDKNILFEAIRDYPTGYKESITEIKKVMVVVKK